MTHIYFQYGIVLLKHFLFGMTSFWFNCLPPQIRFISSEYKWHTIDPSTSCSFPPVFSTQMTKLGVCSSGGIWLFGELCEQLHWQFYRWLFLRCGVRLSFYLAVISALEEP